MIRKTFIPAVFMLAAVFVFCTVQTVESRGMEGRRIGESRYDVWEADYLDGMRRLLEGYGLQNSGITMTKITGADGSRTYEVLIHHRRTAFLDERRQRELEEELEFLSFPAQGCTFYYAFT